MLPRFEHSLLIGSVLLASCQPRPPEPVPQPEPPTVERPETLDFQPVEWADMPGWTERDLAPALQAFQRSCARLNRRADSDPLNPRPDGLAGLKTGGAPARQRR